MLILIVLSAMPMESYLLQNLSSRIRDGPHSATDYMFQFNNTALFYSIMVEVLRFVVVLNFDRRLGRQLAVVCPRLPFYPSHLITCRCGMRTMERPGFVAESGMDNE